MLASEFLVKCNYALRGTDDDAPTASDDDGQYWLDTLNRKIDELYRDPKNWSHIYEVQSIGVVAATATPSFDLPENTIYIESVYIVANGQKHHLTLIKPEEKDDINRAVFIAGANPQTLYVTTEIKSTEEIVGGTVYVTGYFMPDDVAAETDVLHVPNPNWAVVAVAAEIAGNDITYEDKEATLVAKANMLYAYMTKLNRKGQYGRPRVTPYNLKRIPDTRR